MTLVQMQSRPVSTPLVHPVSTPLVQETAAAAMAAAGPQVHDDMTVEVALSVMASARTGHLLVCDNDGVGTGLLTWEGLTAARASATYTDRLQLRDILGGREVFASPVTTTAEVGCSMRHRRQQVLPVVDEHGNAPGVLALAR